MTEAPPPAIEVTDAVFRYPKGPCVLDVESLKVACDERVFLHGPSGSGKTTLLSLLAGVLTAQSGSVRVLGTELGALSGPRRDSFRGHHIGYIFQMFNLIPYLDVMRNITLPCRISKDRARRLGGERPEEAARRLAAGLEIDDLLDERVTALSVGQQQRVAAARALLGAPELVIADEPTSSLDENRRRRFLDVLFECCERAGATLVFVSHDRTLMPAFARSVALAEINRANGDRRPA